MHDSLWKQNESKCVCDSLDIVTAVNLQGAGFAVGSSNAC